MSLICFACRKDIEFGEPLYAAHAAPLDPVVGEQPIAYALCHRCVREYCFDISHVEDPPQNRHIVVVHATSPGINFNGAYLMNFHAMYGMVVGYILQPFGEKVDWIERILDVPVKPGLP